MPENAPFELPDLTGLDRDALKAVETQAVQAFTARYEAGAATPEDLQALQTLAEAVSSVRAAILASDVGSPEPEPEPEPELAPEPEPAPEPTPEPAAPEGGVVLEQFLEALSKQQAAAPAPAPVAVVEPTPVVEPAPVAIAAAGDPRGPQDVQLHVDLSPITIVASADIPGFGTAVPLEGWDGLVAAIGAKARAVPNLAGSKYPVASIMLPLRQERLLDGLSDAEVRERLNDLSSPAFLEAELSRTASGGWCAPNETIYDFACEVEAPPEMVDLPVFGAARRGGINFPISPTYRDFKSLTNKGLFTWTEANDQAAATGGPTKPCFKVPCVTFDSARLELEGLCVTAGNLMEMAYPELIRRYMSLVLTAHLHRMNSKRITKMLAKVDNSITLAATFATASAIFDALLLQVADLRDQFSMASDALVEVMMPRWVRGPARADVARREMSTINDVSDADIQRFWQDAGVRIQFVSDWQELGDPAHPALLWPATVQFLMWLPGAYKLLSGQKLDIAVARDSVLNATNDFTVAFTEEAYQVFKPGCGSRLVTLPICPSGAVGERVLLACD